MPPLAASNDTSAGIFITEIGASVATAADYQYVFNSNWPSLQIAYDVTITIPVYNFSGGIYTVNHNLNMYPYTDVWVRVNGANLDSGRLMSGGNEALPFGLSYYIGKNSIYIQTIDDVNSYIVNIKCYNLNLGTPANYTLPKYPAVKQPYDPAVGIKVTKYNKDITSTDLRDFILHSRAQSPAVLSVVTESSGVASPLGGGLYQISYTNPSGYVPWIYGFGSSTSTGFEALVYFPAGWAVQSAAGLTLSGPTLMVTRPA